MVAGPLDGEGILSGVRGCIVGGELGAWVAGRGREGGVWDDAGGALDGDAGADGLGVLGGGVAAVVGEVAGAGGAGGGAAHSFVFCEGLGGLWVR